MLNLKGAAVPPGDVFGCEKEVLSDDTPSTCSKQTTTWKYDNRCQKRPAVVTTDLLREQVEQQKILLKSINKISET